jgi:hypothetical protein
LGDIFQNNNKQTTKIAPKRRNFAQSGDFSYIFSGENFGDNSAENFPPKMLGKFEFSAEKVLKIIFPRNSVEFSAESYFPRKKMNEKLVPGHTVTEASRLRGWPEYPMTAIEGLRNLLHPGVKGCRREGLPDGICLHQNYRLWNIWESLGMENVGIHN